MALKTKTEIRTSIRNAIQDASPQVRIDANKGAFYYLASEAVSGPLSETGTEVERMARIASFAFPRSVTNQEAVSTARAFGLPLGSGGFASGTAYVFTSRRPTGTETLIISEGTVFSTANSRGQTFAAVQAKAITPANADAFFNPSTSRYEIPVKVRALTAGVSGNIAARTLTVIQGGASSFDGVTNYQKFTGGTSPQSVNNLYTRVQQKLPGLDTFSRGGILNRTLNLDPDRIQAAALTYSSEYPNLFYRLPDDQAIDIWVLATTNAQLHTDYFTAAQNQTTFPLSQKPALSLVAAEVNGAATSAALLLDQSSATGRSTKENSYVVLQTPATQGQVVEITYTYDQLLADIQADIDGHLQKNTGSLFATDVLVRYAKSLPAAITVVGKALGTNDPTTVEEDVIEVIGDFIASGAAGDAPPLGGQRTADQLRNLISSRVPGIATFSIPIFCRESVGTIVEAIDIPRHSAITLDPTKLVARFT